METHTASLAVVALVPIALVVLPSPTQGVGCEMSTVDVGGEVSQGVLKIRMRSLFCW